MSATTFSSLTQDLAKPKRVRRILLGGWAALAESAWMGSVQASDVLEPLHTPSTPTAPWRAIRPRLPQIQWRGLLTREFSVAEASFILMVSFFSSALLGAIRQILFNAQFGVSVDANAYYAAFRLPDTLFSLVAGGALSSAMIPVLLATQQEDGENAAARLIRLVLTTLLCFFGLLVLLALFFTPTLVTRLLAPGFDITTSQLTISLTRLMLLQPLILAAGSVATAVLNSRNQFLLTGLSIVSHNIALIAGILLARYIPALGIYGPTLGVIAGAILQVLILAPGLSLSSSPSRGFSPPTTLFAWDLTNQRLREIIRLLIPNGASVGVNYAGNIADTAFASTASEMAALGSIYNAWLLVGLPIALLGQAVGQAAFPRLAAQAEKGDWRPMRKTLVQSLLAAVLLSLLALAALTTLGRTVIHILFERGEFTAQAGDLTYRVMVAYAVALPAYVATEVISRGLIALRDTRTPLITNICQLIGRITIMATLVGSLGVIVIPAALALTASLETIVLGSVLALKLQKRIT